VRQTTSGDIQQSSLLVPIFNRNRTPQGTQTMRDGNQFTWLVRLNDRQDFELTGEGMRRF
jgi:hypothetical protein